MIILHWCLDGFAGATGGALNRVGLKEAVPANSDKPSRGAPVRLGTRSLVSLGN